MNENVKVVFGLIGGLALFLYGMNSMSDALQKAAGDKMKKVLGKLRKHCRRSTGQYSICRDQRGCEKSRNRSFR